MISYTTVLTTIANMSKVPSTDTTNTNFLIQLWNDSIKTVCKIRGGKWKFLEYTVNRATIASQRNYAIPARMEQIMDLYVTVGNRIYRPTPVYDSQQWNAILGSNMAASDITLFYKILGNQVHFAPVSATTAGTITFRGRLRVRDLTTGDVSVTVTALANNDTAVTISSGGLASMAGKFIRLPFASAANSGDGFWYEIASATATTITLVAPYEGTTITAGNITATISEMTPFPEGYDMAPLYRMLAQFWDINDPIHPEHALRYWMLYDGGQEIGRASVPGGLIGQMIEHEQAITEGAYISPNVVQQVDPNYPPRYPLTGF